jgi:hypothetical protein
MAKGLGSEGPQKYVGFYWTLPIPRVGFLRLSDDPDIAATQSKTIKYQREVIKEWVAEEGGLLIREITFLETQSDRGTDVVVEYVQRAAGICRENAAALVYVDFRQMRGWRPHQHLTFAIENEQIPSVPVWPSHEAILIDGKRFHPARHFKDHRMEHEKEAARRHETAIKRLLKEAEVMPPGRGRNALIADRLNAEGVQTFQGGRPWTADNVKKVLQRLKAKR